MAMRFEAAASRSNILRYKGLDHQLEDAARRTEILTKAAELLDKTIGH